MLFGSGQCRIVIAHRGWASCNVRKVLVCKQFRPSCLRSGRVRPTSSKSERLGVPGCEFFVEYHAAQVKRAANEVLGEFEVEVRPDFTALDSPSEHLRAGPASGIDDGAGRLLQQVFGST